MTYTVKTNKQLASIATSLSSSMKQFNQRVQSFLGDFVISYNNNKNNNPFNTLMQALSADKKYARTRTAIIQWVSATTNYKVKWTKEKNTFAITYKDNDNKYLTTNEEFDTTTFMDFMESRETEKKPFDKDVFIKQLKALIAKADKNSINWESIITLK